MGKAFKIPISIWIFIIAVGVAVSGFFVPVKTEVRIGLLTLGLLVSFVDIIMLPLSIIKEKLSDIDENLKKERKIEIVERPMDNPVIQHQISHGTLRVYNPMFTVARDKSVLLEGILPTLRNIKKGKMIVSPKRIEDMEKLIDEVKNKSGKRKIKTLVEKLEVHRMVDSLGMPSYTFFISKMNATTCCLFYIPEEPFMSGRTPHWGFFIHHGSLVTELINKFDDVWDNRSIEVNLVNLMKKLGIT